MNSKSKIETAFEIINNRLSGEIIESSINISLRRAKFHLSKGINLYLRYNDHDEYSYHFQYSPEKYDRIRFDNFDKEWSVESKPHHFHLRNQKSVERSPMIGDPTHDMEYLLDKLAETI